MDDYYPTVEVFLASENASDTYTVRYGRKVLADFDTGNPYYTILGEKLCKGIAPEPAVYEFHKGSHLGKVYWFFLRKLRLCVRDARGNVRGIVTPVRLVRDWKASPLLLANPRREGFTGRHLMYKLKFKITLNPEALSSEILLL